MANESGTVAKRASTSLFSWLVDQAIERWPTIAAALFAGGGMSYLASISTWLQPYGPVAYGAVALVAILACSFVYFLYGVTRARIEVADYTRRKSESSATHVLAPIHQFEKINLSEFYHPFHKPTMHARFETCDLMGPAMLILEGGTVSGNRFHMCEILIVKSEVPIEGAIRFQLCSFINCDIFRVTLAMTKELYALHPEEFRSKLPIISDGQSNL